MSSKRNSKTFEINCSKKLTKASEDRTIKSFRENLITTLRVTHLKPILDKIDLIFRAFTECPLMSTLIICKNANNNTAFDKLLNGDALSTLRNLSKVYLIGSLLTNENLEAISRLAGLKHLVLESCDPRNDALDFGHLNVQMLQSLEYTGEYNPTIPMMLWKHLRYNNLRSLTISTLLNMQDIKRIAHGLLHCRSLTSLKWYVTPMLADGEYDYTYAYLFRALDGRKILMDLEMCGSEDEISACGLMIEAGIISTLTFIDYKYDEETHRRFSKRVFASTVLKKVDIMGSGFNSLFYDHCLRPKDFTSNLECCEIVTLPIPLYDFLLLYPRMKNLTIDRLNLARTPGKDFDVFGKLTDKHSLEVLDIAVLVNENGLYRLEDIIESYQNAMDRGLRLRNFGIERVQDINGTQFVGLVDSKDCMRDIDSWNEQNGLWLGQIPEIKHLGYRKNSDRNRRMHAMAAQSSITFMALAKRQVLSPGIKDVSPLIAKYLYNTRSDIESWSPICSEPPRKKYKPKNKRDRKRN